MRDKQSGRSRGFAFVTFGANNEETIRDIKQKLLKPSSPHILHDRNIEVKEGDGNKPADSFLSSKLEEDLSVNKNETSESGKNHNRDRKPREKLRKRSRSRDAEVRNEVDSNIRNKVFVGGLDYGLVDEEFANFFEQFGQVKSA